MSLLFRYLIKNNTKILLLTLAIGISVYILTDLFERLDNFIEAHTSTKIILTYFIYKTPFAIAQILPFIFLISTVIQLCIMAKKKELIALQAGGISFTRIASIIIISSLFWGTIQFIFSEYIGTAGARKSLQIWQEYVHNQHKSKTILKDIWFTDKNWIVSINTLKPDNTGGGFSAYLLDKNGLTIEKIIWALSFSIHNNKWILKKVAVSEPALYSQEMLQELTLTFNQSPETLRFIQNNNAPQQLSFWELGETIHKLERSGSNVELLKTSWHTKLSYSFSLVVMALLATTIVAWKNNIYIAIAFSLLYTFIYNALNTIGISLGNKGIISPIIGAWIANLVIMSVTIWKLFFINPIKNSLLKIHSTK